MAYKEAHAGNSRRTAASGEQAASASRAVTGSTSAFEAGQRAGRSLNLNRAIGGSSSGVSPGHEQRHVSSPASFRSRGRRGGEPLIVTRP